MKDHVFTGRTVTEALELAGRTLGLSPDSIRYVVLERETPGVLGLGGTPARIAVLLEPRGGGAPAAGGPRRADAPASRSAPAGRVQDPRAAIRAFVRSFAEASGLDLTAEIQEEEEARVVVRLFGDDRSFLLEDGAEVLVALDH